MALLRPMFLLTRMLKNRTCIVQHACQCSVSLSVREVKPITIKEANDALLDMVGSFYSDAGGGMKIENIDDMLPIQKRQEDCPVRSMSDSYEEVIIPLGQDLHEREKYISSHKNLRLGRLLEDLDIFAGWICYVHNQNPAYGHMLKSPLSTVTALVHRIDFHDKIISPTKDVKMRGHVTWVGTSSMEVTMVVEQEVDSKMQEKMTARFIMVSRDPQTEKAAVVNPLQPTDERERALFELGERHIYLPGMKRAGNKKLRVEEAKKSLLKTAPTEEERLLIHDIYLRTVDKKSTTFSVRVKPENSEPMEKTKLTSMSICHPELYTLRDTKAYTMQQRNIYQKIFGGFLMRQAYELAYSAAALYCQRAPVPHVVDDIVFRKPVEIGSLLYFTAQIVYTEGSLMLVKVHAEVLDIPTSSRETTNDFYFVFDGRKANVPTVLPHTYAESMRLLDGMRHMKKLL